MKPDTTLSPRVSNPPTLAPMRIAPHTKPEKDWLSRKEAADYLTRKGRPISAGRLGNMASNNNAGKGPSFTRPCWNRVQYRRDDLDAWLKREAVVIP